MSDSIMMQTRVVPLNFGPLHGANVNTKKTGPCGDTMEFWLAVKDDDTISFATYTTDGCYHSMICGSAAAAIVIGKKLDFIKKLTYQDVLAMPIATDIPKESHHCAQLAIDVLNMAVEKYHKTTKEK